MQWCSSSWCFSSGRERRRWLAMATAAGACSGTRRAGASPRGGSIGVGWRWLLLLVHAVVLVELVLLLGERALASGRLWTDPRKEWVCRRCFCQQPQAIVGPSMLICHRGWTRRSLLRQSRADVGLLVVRRRAGLVGLLVVKITK
jgi:hypothetical protein